MMRFVLLALLAACEQPRTEMVVGVVTDIHAPDLLDGARLLITRANDGFVEQDVSWQLSGVANVPVNLPGSYGVYSDGEEVKLDLTLLGLKNDNTIVTRRSVLNLVEGKTLFFRMSLVAGCVDRTDCLDTQSCVEGVCRDVGVDSHQLPDFEEQLVDHVSCSNGTAFIDTGTGAALPPTEGADNCPASLCLEGVCLNPPPDPEPGARTVTGYQFTQYVETTKSTNVPTMGAVSALVPQSDGSYMTIPGTSNPDGSFVINQVPNGTYYLQSGTSYFVTDADVFDLTQARAGRPDAKPAAAGTGVNFQSVTNFGSWMNGNTFEVCVPGADTWWFGLEAVTPITPGTTALTNYAFQNSAASGSLKNLIVNDPITALELELKTSAQTGLAYLAATKLFQPPAFTQLDGMVTNVPAGAFVDIPQTAMLQTTFPTSKWDAMTGWSGTELTAFNPHAAHPVGAETYDVFVHSQPGSPIYGQFSATADFMVVSFPHGADVTISDVTFGMPTLQGQWSPLISVDVNAGVYYVIPGTNTPGLVRVGARTTGLLSTLTPEFFDPKLGPVRSPTIDGLDLFQSQMQQVSTTPTLTWQPPAVGNPSLYTVQIFELTANGSTTVAPKTPMASLTTSATSLAMPPGLLMLGHYYVFRILAQNTPNTDAPFRLRLPQYFSSTASGLIVPTMNGSTNDPPSADAGMGSGGGLVDAPIIIMPDAGP